MTIKPTQKKDPGVKAPGVDNEILIKQSATYNHIESKLKEYVSTMMPGRSHSTGEGEAAQLNFFRTIVTILKLEGGEFNTMFTLLLSIVNSNKNTVFSDRYVFRYYNQLKMSNIERKQYERIVTLLLVLCNPAIRPKALKQIDISAVMNVFNDQNIHQRVTSYFSGY